jgi:hypothetical protein
MKQITFFNNLIDLNQRINLNINVIIFKYQLIFHDYFTYYNLLSWLVIRDNF